MPDYILLNSHNGTLDRDIPHELDPALVPPQFAPGCWSLGLYPQEQQRAFQVSDEG